MDLIERELDWCVIAYPFVLVTDEVWNHAFTLIMQFYSFQGLGCFNLNWFCFDHAIRIYFTKKISYKL